MDRKVLLTAEGGVENFRIVEDAPKNPGPGELRIRHEAIGVNFLDIYHRTGFYSLPSLPAVPGVEGAGIVEAVGADVVGFKVGDRVAYAGAPVGSYASVRLLPAYQAVLLPDDIPTRLAAASMLRGLTAHMLLTQTYAVGPDSTILVHAAAGGLGVFLVRWAKYLGARVIGTVSNETKAVQARANGADDVIIGRDADVIGEIRDLTGGKGVDFAVDGIGGDMLAKTLQCVRLFGTVASVGAAAGPIPPISIEQLGPRHPISLTRPSVITYAAMREVYPVAAKHLLDVMKKGVVPEIGATYALDDVASSHRDLEAGRTTGSILLMP